MDHLQPEVTQRGLKHMPAIQSTYGGYIRAYESSAADNPYIWINTLQDHNDGVQAREATVHLTLEDASRLRDQLTYLIDHHYQMESLANDVHEDYVKISELFKDQND